MEHLSQSLLAQPFGSAEHPENARMRRRKTQTSKPLREFASSVRPHLGEQESRRRGLWSSTGIFHVITIAYYNRL
jgi:hypothetical protein